MADGFLGESSEERFGQLADNLGYCDVCPRRVLFLEFMAEENPVNVPDSWKEEAATVSGGCERAQQIRRGEEPVARGDCLPS